MYNFTKNKPYYWLMLIVSYVLIFAEILGIYQDWTLPQFLIYTSRILLIIVWVFCLIDMIKNQLFNKTFWIFSMFILTPLCLPSYLWLREKLIKIKK